MRSAFLGSAFLLLSALFLLSSPATARSTEAEFTHQIADRLRAALPGHAVETTSEPMQLRIVATPEPFTVNFGRVFNYCQTAAAQDCAASIDRFIAGTSESVLHPPSPITRAQLRLLVRNVEYCDAISQGDSGPLRGPILRPFVPGLCTLLMADLPTTMHSVSEEQLRPLNLTPEAAWALAERQTLAQLPRPEQLEGLHDAFAALTGYDYMTSLLLNTEGWRAAAAAQGELVVAVPDSSSMIVVRRANIADLARFRALVREQMNAAERGVSPNLYHWTAAGWALLE
jgi:hypothetical protein